jgi:putative spermidine/putrescine transport system substrate-binding protein
VKTPPTSIKGLLNAEYKNQVALNGDPTKAGAAFAGVFAAALANGGSVTNIQPGIDFFSSLKKAGNFIPVEATPATVQSGQTPITLDWDYIQAKYKDEASGKVDWKVVVPSDAQYGGFYTQAIVKNSPHPAAARLWEEFLYSAAGQNLWLKGGARPILLEAMKAAGTANKTYLAALPDMPAGAKPTFATLIQQLNAKIAVAQNWSKI